MINSDIIVVCEANGDSRPVTGRAARIIRYITKHADRINDDRKGRIEFSFAGESVIPSHQSVLDPID